MRDRKNHVLMGLMSVGDFTRPYSPFRSPCVCLILRRRRAFIASQLPSSPLPPRYRLFLRPFFIALDDRDAGKPAARTLPAASRQRRLFIQIEEIGSNYRCLRLMLARRSFGDIAQQCRCAFTLRALLHALMRTVDDAIFMYKIKLLLAIR